VGGGVLVGVLHASAKKKQDLAKENVEAAGSKVNRIKDVKGYDRRGNPIRNDQVKQSLEDQVKKQAKKIKNLKSKVTLAIILTVLGGLFLAGGATLFLLVSFKYSFMSGSTMLGFDLPTAQSNKGHTYKYVGIIAFVVGLILAVVGISLIVNNKKKIEEAAASVGKNLKSVKDDVMKANKPIEMTQFR
jgi:flagellar basal body-associated protein FliL